MFTMYDVGPGYVKHLGAVGTAQKGTKVSRTCIDLERVEERSSELSSTVGAKALGLIR